MFTFACKLGCWLDGVVLKRKFEHGSNTVLRNSKANRTVSPGCHGLMHLFTHTVPQKPGRTSRRRFQNSGDCKMQQDLLFCFSSRIRPLKWQCKQRPGCSHLRDQDEERYISLVSSLGFYTLIYIYISYYLAENLGPFMPTCCFSLIFISLYIYIYI